MLKLQQEAKFDRKTSGTWRSPLISVASACHPKKIKKVQPDSGQCGVISKMISLSNPVGSSQLLRACVEIKKSWREKKDKKKNGTGLKVID